MGAGGTGYGGAGSYGALPGSGRLTTALARLKLQWEDARSSAEKPVAAKQAVQMLRGGDPRPLLILRDCEGCPNKEGNLLVRTLNDERFILASDWFHCVKIDPQALEENHPFRELFRGNKPPHFVLSTWDGENVVPVTRAGQKEIWKAMRAVIRKSYEKRPDKAVKDLRGLLDDYDALDRRESVLKRQLEVKEDREQSRQVRKIEAELAKLQERREELFEREEKLRELVLRPRPGEEPEQQG